MSNVEVRPYTYWRIKRLLHKYYNYELVKIYHGYKADRVPGFVQKYEVITEYSKETVATNLSLNDIRAALTALDYPLKDEDDFLYELRNS